MSKLGPWTIAAVAMVLCACNSQKEPAQQAINRIDSDLAAVHDSASKYAAESLQSVDGQVSALRASYQRGDYKKVLADAPAVRSSIASLKQDVDAKQAQADAAAAQTKQQWRTLSNDVPKLVAAVHQQVDSLSKSHKMPRGMNKAAFESAKNDAAGLDSAWSDAENTVSNGNDYAGAVQKGQSVKDKATALLQQLGGKPPA
jgi:chromosome segregation ATPase